MDIVIVRHAPAKDSLKWLSKGREEGQRPLTKKGIAKMQAAIRGLRQLLGHVDVMMSSPWVRAMQTAELLKEAYKLDTITSVEALLPHKHPEDLLKELRLHDQESTVMLVGHETYLSECLAYLTVGTHDPFMYFQKGGVAYLSCEGHPTAGACDLKWLMTRKMLEQIGDIPSSLNI